MFSFIVRMMETAIKSAPHTTPTKPGTQQEKEVNNFENEVWLKVFALMDENIMLSLEEDMEDANMSGL